MKPILLILTLLMASVSFGQLPGDFNCDGVVIGSDIQFWYNYLFGYWCDNLMECSFANGDFDGDGITLTIADFYSLQFYFGQRDSPAFANNPESDTLFITSAEASPGDVLTLPIFVKTMDTLTALQIYVKVDSNYISLQSVTFYQSFPIRSAASRCGHELHLFTFPEYPCAYWYWPGTHLYADLHIEVKEDIDEEVTTWIEASFNPEYALNTGFANLEFFAPVLVNGEISITPTDIEDDNFNKDLPISFLVNSCPNPFNASTMIKYELPYQSKVKIEIYDILGQKVGTLEDGLQPAGYHQTIWNAGDLPSGIYFYKLQAGDYIKTKKMMLVK